MNNIKDGKNDIKSKKTISKNKKKNQDPLKNFKKLLIKERDNLNQSQKNFFYSPKIKLGQR